MIMTEGQVFRCQSCACEIKVIRPSEVARANPKCGCGAPMKKAYRKPAVRKLNSAIDVFTLLKASGN